MRSPWWYWNRFWRSEWEVKFNFDWLIGKKVTLEERNKRLAERATLTERRATLLEEEAVLQKRLLTARQRCNEAKRSMSVWKPNTLKWVMIAVAGTLILFAMFKSC